MRIASLLPSATEILYALGLGESVVGVSHECDYPASARSKPRLIRTAIDQDRLSSREIDQAVRTALQARRSLYEFDLEALSRARPDVVIIQSLCEVCAVDPSTALAALQTLNPQPQVITLHPHSLAGVFQDIRTIGHATNRNAEAGRLVRGLLERMERVRERIPASAPPTVFCLEWLEPPMASGHWVPEQVECAGGRELLGRAGEPSRYVTWQEVAAAAPQVLVLMPCGFPSERTRKEASVLTSQPWWEALPAVRDGRVYLVDGPAYFNRSGPRLVDGIELLAGLFHPDRCRDLLPGGTAVAAL
jgi:iron complex transport system substrate-binding protein